MAYRPATPVGSGSGGGGKPKESASGGVQSGRSTASGGGSGGGGGGGSNVSQAQFEEQVQAVQVVTGGSSKEAAQIVRDVIARGQSISTDPKVLSRLRTERQQGVYETQVQAVQAATGGSSKDSAKFVRELAQQGKQVNTSPELIRSIRESRVTAPSSTIQQRAAVDPVETVYRQRVDRIQQLGIPQRQEQKPVTYPSSISAQTKEERRKTLVSKAKDILAPIWEGFTLQQPGSTRESSFTKPMGTEAAAFTFGAVGGFASLEVGGGVAATERVVGRTAVGSATRVAAKAATREAAVVPKAVGATRRFSEFIPINRITAGSFIKTTAISLGVGIGGVELGKEIARETAPMEQRKLLSQGDVKEAIREAAKKRDVAVSDLPWYKGLAADTIPFYRPAEKEFTQALETELKQRGIPVEQGVAAVKRQRLGGEIGEIAGLVGVGAASNRLGRTIIGLGFKETAELGAKRTASNVFTGSNVGLAAVSRSLFGLGVAGAQEGIVTEVVQSRSRDRELTAKNVALAAGFGAISSATIGSSIIGLAPTKPKASKVVEFASYIIDPLEKPGDIVDEATEIIGKRLGAKGVISPSIIQTGEGKKTRFSFGVTPQPVVQFSNIVQQQTSVAPRPQVNPVATPITTEFLGSIAEPFVPIEPRKETKPSIPQNPITSTKITPSVPPSTPIEPVVDIPPEEQIPVDVPVAIDPSGIFVNTPISTPLFRRPPPPLGGFPRGAQRTLGKEGKRYLDELGLAFQGFFPRTTNVRGSKNSAGRKSSKFGREDIFARLFYGGPPRGKRK